MFQPADFRSGRWVVRASPSGSSGPPGGHQLRTARPPIEGPHTLTQTGTVQTRPFTSRAPSERREEAGVPREPVQAWGEHANPTQTAAPAGIGCFFHRRCDETMQQSPVFEALLCLELLAGSPFSDTISRSPQGTLGTATESPPSSGNRGGAGHNRLYFGREGGF